MATASAIQTRVLGYLYGSYPSDRPFTSEITAAYTNVATTVSVTDGTDWAEGDELENPSTEEVMRVISVSANDLTVERAIEGTATASDGTDDRIHKNSRFPRVRVTQAITDAIESLELWGVHIFGVEAITRSSAIVNYYELTSTDIVDSIGVSGVYYVESVTKRPVFLPFQEFMNLGTNPADYTQGRGIAVFDWGEVATTENVEVIYAKKISATTDLLTRQEEIVVQGACALMLGKTIAPFTQDPGARTDRTVQPGQTVRDGRWYQANFFVSVRAEAATLAVERQRSAPQSPRLGRARRWRG
jgi:hypothetical protein